MFEENGRELVWTFFVDEILEQDWKFMTVSDLGTEMGGDEYWMHSWSKK